MDRSDAWFLVVVASVVGCIGGMAWTDFGHAVDWLYHYQSLIAGVLAVAAAIGTIVQMRTSDRAQDDRHRDLMRLSVRPDLLKIQRAAVPYAGYLRQFYADGYRLVQPGPDHLPTVGQEQRDAFISAVNAAIYTFRRNEIGEILSYLDPKTSQIISREKEQTVPHYEKALAHWQAQVVAGAASAESDFTWVAAMGMGILFDGAELANSLDELLEMYRSGRVY